jgi:hypothetical protein
MDEALIKRLTDFRESFRFKIEQEASKLIDEYAEKHYGEQLPIDELMELMHQTAVACTGVVLKNMVLVATYYNDVGIGVGHLDAMVTDYENSVSNIEELREQLVSCLTENVNINSVH